MSTYDGSVNGGVLLRSNMTRQLFEDHIWLSVIYRKSRSPFTRVQRISCCLALLYLTMIANAMWYKDSADKEDSPEAGIFKLGPITVTTYELYASIMSSVIVVPPMTFIIFCFTNSREKPPKESKNMRDTYSSFSNDLIKFSVFEPVKKKRLPYWCVYVSWVIISLAVLASAFFTLLYSFEWGKVKSMAWLMTFLLSFIESVMMIQPLQVSLRVSFSIMLKSCPHT